MRVSTLTFTVAFAMVYTIVSARALWSSDHGYFSRNQADVSNSPLTPSIRTTKKTNAKQTASEARIKLSAYADAQVFVNGVLKEKVDPGSTATVTVAVEKGDVVGILAEKTADKAAILATIVWNGKTYRSDTAHYRTRADEFVSWPADQKSHWNQRVDKSNKELKQAFCKWDKADEVDIDAKKFDNKARFIWKLVSTGKRKNKKTLPAHTVHFRHVIGGDNCGGSKENGRNASGGDDDDEDEDDDKDEKKKNKTKSGKKSGSDDDDDGKNKSNKKSGKDEDDEDDKKDKKHNKIKSGKKNGSDDDQDDDDDKKKSNKKMSGKDDDEDDDTKGKKSNKKQSGENDDGKKKSNKKSGKDDDDEDDDKGGKNNNKDKSEKKSSSNDDDSKNKDDGKKKGKKNGSDDDGDDDAKPKGRVPTSKEQTETESNTSYDKTDFSGQSDSAEAESCKCKMSSSTGGECYDMENPNEKEGVCKPRPCAAKFECAEDGIMICVKRHIMEKVVMVRPHVCKMVASESDMLMPYNG